MSCQRGNASRTRPQKYRNRTVFKNDLHDKTDQQKKINSLHVSEVCQHCKDVIEWKIKYKKYKPLSQPKTCTRCQQRSITKAYHVLCRYCALETRVCAKCQKNEESVDIETPKPSLEEELTLKVEMERLIKSLPERKRRAFLRCMNRRKEPDSFQRQKEATDNECLENKEQSLLQQRLPHSREELLQRIEFLKLQDEQQINSESEESEPDG